MTMKRILAAGGLMLLAAPAMAHVTPGESHGLVEGLMHPLSGVDHLLALIAMGLWSATLSARMRVAGAGVVALLLATAALLGVAGFALPHMELGLALSVLVLGLMLAFAFRQPVAGLALVAVFTLFHGNAHGIEWPTQVSLFGYLAGFLAISMALFAGGQLIGAQLRQSIAVRATGGLFALAGAWLVLG